MVVLAIDKVSSWINKKKYLKIKLILIITIPIIIYIIKIIRNKNLKKIINSNDDTSTDNSNNWIDLNTNFSNNNSIFKKLMIIIIKNNA